MQIFNRDDHRSVLTAAKADLAQGVKRAGFNRLRTQASQGRPIARHIQQMHEIRHFFIASHAGSMDHLFHFVFNRIGRIRSRDFPGLPQGIPQGIPQGQIGRCIAVGDTVALTIDHLVGVKLMLEFVEQAGFAHPGFPNDAYDLAPAGPHVVQEGIEGLQLPLPSHKGVQSVVRPSGL